MNEKRNAFPRVEQWQLTHFSTPPFDHLQHIMRDLEQSAWPKVDELSEFLTMPADGIQFSEQLVEGRYYEQIVYEDKQVPTRVENWHDFYNACIWRLFPKSKQALNHLHIQEIEQCGLKPRTPRRDRVTHFDECGVILAYSNEHIPALLGEHEWQSAFVEGKSCWGKKAQAFIFGHANYEMLMQPHIGLTGKWFGICVDEAFWRLPIAAQYQHLDAQLLDYILQPTSFTVKADLKPLPLLGVPTWFADNEDPSFYHNAQYFRPKRR